MRIRGPGETTGRIPADGASAQSRFDSQSFAT
jgi:hypothetical protein